MAPQSLGWLWLFPLSYALHIAEEGFAGERFYNWLRRVPVVKALDLGFGARGFFAANAVFMLAMIAAVWASSHTGFAFLVPALGTIVAVNGLGHLGGCLITRHYSPGTVSGLLVWLPLGLYALIESHRVLAPGPFLTGVVAGIVAHAAVFAVALAVGLKGRPARAG